jgi:hypothetical protein
MLAVLKSEIVPLNLTWRWLGGGGEDLNYEHPVIERHGLRTCSTRSVNLDLRLFSCFGGGHMCTLKCPLFPVPYVTGFQRSGGFVCLSS